MQNHDSHWKIEIKSWGSNRIALQIGLAVTGLATVFCFFIWLISIDFAVVEFSARIHESKQASQRLTGGIPAEQTRLLNGVISERAPSINTSSLSRKPALSFIIPQSLINSLKPYLMYDLSTITYFLIFWFAHYCFMGVLDLKRQKLNAAMLAEFPFPQNFQISWVQWGLIGTLWGFLLLGFGLRVQDDQASFSSDFSAITLLIQAFGTALLSTFTAVVLAYMAAPFFQKIFSICLHFPIQPKSYDKTSADFVNYLQNVNSSLKELSDTVDCNRSKLISELSKIGCQMNASSNDIKEAFQSPKGPLKEIVAKADTTNKSLLNIQKTFTKAEDIDSRILKGMDAIISKPIVDTLKEQSKSYQEIIVLQTSIDKTNSEIQKSFDKINEHLESMANEMKRNNELLPGAIEAIKVLGEKMGNDYTELCQLYSNIADKKKESSVIMEFLKRIFGKRQN